MSLQVFLMVNAPALLVVGVLIAATFRGLRRSTWLGFAIRLLAGVAVIFVLCVAAMFALKPWANSLIAECEAAGGFSCEDDGLAVALPIIPAMFAWGYWIVAALALRVFFVFTARGSQAEGAS